MAYCKNSVKQCIDSSVLTQRNLVSCCFPPLLARRLLRMQTMRIAIAHWRDRVSPVFDVSDRIVLVDIENGRELQRKDQSLKSRKEFERAQEVCGHGVQVLLCGALSNSMQSALKRTGIQVISFICGDLEDVLNAYVQGRLSDQCYQMPGIEGKTAKGE